jgi:MFS family permease
MLSGNVLLGISLCMILIPNIPEMIEAVKQKQQVNKDDEVTLEKISDLATGLFGSFIAFGNFFAPIIGGLLSDNLRFQSTCDIMALSSLLFGLIYLGVNTVPFIIEKKESGERRGLNMSI